MARKSQLAEFAEKLGELEKYYNVKIISSNGYTDAIIVDQFDGKGYEYQKGTLTLSDDE